MGIEEYKDPKLTDLDKPINDMNALYNVLINKYTFEEKYITRLENPSFEEMIIALDKLGEELTEKDNLLIFYAGHGIYNEKMKQGFWLPSDAKEENTSRWFRNSTLRDYIGGIQAKHTLLISDACFSGSIFKSRSDFDNASLVYFKLNQLKSRKAMTSGSLKTVSDNSIFLKYLMKNLISNKNKYLTSQELFGALMKPVMNNSRNVPLFGEIQDVGDEGGDFIFIQRDN